MFGFDSGRILIACPWVDPKHHSTYRPVAQIPHAAMQQRRLPHGRRDLATRGVIKIRLGVRGFPVMWRHFADDQPGLCVVIKITRKIIKNSVVKKKTTAPYSVHNSPTVEVPTGIPRFFPVLKDICYSVHFKMKSAISQRGIVKLSLKSLNSLVKQRP